MKDTFLTVKERIEQSRGVPVGQQRLLFAGEELQNETVLSTSNIQTASALHLVVLK